MDARHILDFISRLTANNNREWFNGHKEEYLAVKADLEQFTAKWIAAMADVDPQLALLTPKDCMYRIYRDTRFSANKLPPYKDWIGIILAPHGGRKSQHSCYYLHFQPGQCMFAGGMWCPEPDTIKALRRDIYDNYQELEELFARGDVKPYFTSFDTDGQLKKVPAPYPKDFPHPTWIARNSFTFSIAISDKQICSKQFFSHLMNLCHAAQPINSFLDYTLDNL